MPDLTNEQQQPIDITTLATLAAQTVIDANVDTVLVEVVEIEQHLHHRERWWGSTGADTETNATEANVDTPYSVDSGNDTWGVATPIKGTADNIGIAGDTFFDAHFILVTDTDHATPYRLRFIYGSGTSGDAITAGQWSEIMFITAAGPFLSGAEVEIHMPRVAMAWKLWVQVWNATNSSNVLFFYGSHSYLV